MAEEVRIDQSGATAKVRNPLGVIGLSLITIGIYYLFWWYFINREMRDLGRARGVDLGQNPGNSVLAVSLGALIIVPAVITLWTTSGRIESAQRAVGMDRTASGPIIFILLILIGPVGLWYAQSELNKVWEIQSGAADAGALPDGQPAQQPPTAPERPETAPVERGPE